MNVSNKYNNIAITGTGKMGSAIVDLFAENKKEIATQFNTTNSVSAKKLSEVDLVIDCSVGEAFLENLPMYLDAKVDVIVVASNWYDRLQEIESKVLDSGINFLYSDNYAIGSYVYKQIIETAFEKLTGLGFDFALQESHHHFKKDYPSAVARKIAQSALEKLTEKKTWSADPVTGMPNKDVFYISSLRYGTNTVAHSLKCASSFEDIEINHTVRDRKVFAQGILEGLHFLESQKTGLYNMKDLVHWMMQGKNSL